jgi:hypothetical protein
MSRIIDKEEWGYRICCIARTGAAVRGKQKLASEDVEDRSLPGRRVELVGTDTLQVPPLQLRDTAILRSLAAGRLPLDGYFFRPPQLSLPGLFTVFRTRLSLLAGSMYEHSVAEESDSERV